MGTLFDYLKWRGDLKFSQAPFNEVDNLIFSLISYVNLDGIVPRAITATAISMQDAADAFFKKNPDIKKTSVGLIVPKEILKLFRVAKNTERFRNVKLISYVNEIDLQREMQFSAVTFLPDDHSISVVYRGTDDTLVGWKENFNMCFLPVVPAQRSAASYLEEIATAIPDLPIRVMGHSKGGNLAVYAAVNCAETIRNRLINVWSNDGPGFHKNILEDADYTELRTIIRAFVPQNAVIGMLLEHGETYTVIKSRQKGIYQHNGLTWEVMGNGFVHLDDVKQGAKRLDHVLKAWISEMTPEQREQFVEALFAVLYSNNAMTLTELAAQKTKWLQKGKELDPQVYKTIQKTFSALIGQNTKNIISELFPSKKQ